MDFSLAIDHDSRAPELFRELAFNFSDVASTFERIDKLTFNYLFQEAFWITLLAQFLARFLAL